MEQTELIFVVVKFTQSNKFVSEARIEFHNLINKITRLCCLLVEQSTRMGCIEIDNFVWFSHKIAN